MKKILEIKNLDKIYDSGEVKVHALREISMELYEGEFLAIMGPSGSGKSTFMNILGCLDRPTSGEYYINGRNVSSMDSDELADIRNSMIGFVFQGFNLLSKQSAKDNVELPLFYSRKRIYTLSEKEQLARQALESVGLGNRMNHFPRQLSGGQQQRVAIARALITQPALILADEPTGNLDSRTSVEIMKIFQDLNKNKGITIALVTHSDEIARYAHRIVVFKDGRIRELKKVQNRLDASELLKSMPLPEEEQ